MSGIKPTVVFSDKVIAMMTPEDRKEHGLLTVEECQEKQEQRSEKELQRLCEAELSLRGIEYLHLSFRAREKCGYPDLTFACRGMPCACELKSNIGKLSQAQKEVLQSMKKNGWHVFIVKTHAFFLNILNGRATEIDEWKPEGGG